MGLAGGEHRRFILTHPDLVQVWNNSQNTTPTGWAVERGERVQDENHVLRLRATT